MINSAQLTQLSRTIGMTKVAPSIDLKGNVILITGGASGIGGALARAAHLYGASVIAVDIQEPLLEELTKELGSERFVGISRNLMAPMDDKFLNNLQNAAAKFGKIDGYVMNAGAVKLFNKEKAKDLLSTPVSESRDLIQLNALSHLEIFQAIHPFLSNDARIVTTSSPIVGRQDLHTLGYALSKRMLNDIAFHIQNQMKGTNTLVTGYVPPPVQCWLRADLKSEPFGANAFPEDVIELPLRLLSSTLPKSHDAKMFVYADKRLNATTKEGIAYQYNQRTEMGVDLGVKIRDLNKGGGTEGDIFIESYDTYNSRQLSNQPRMPAINEDAPLLEVYKVPSHISKNRL